MTMKRTLPIVLTMLLMAMPASAADGEPAAASTDCSARFDADGAICPPLDLTPDPNPWVMVHLGFELVDCKGVKQRVVNVDATVGGGAAKGGPVWVAFAFVKVKITTDGWSWQYSCTLRATQDMYGEGGGSVFRETYVYANTPYGQVRTEASCHYDGVLTDTCKTPVLIKKGSEFIITDEGHTNGYPLKVEASSRAVGVNKPADREPICVIHPPCYHAPSVGQLIDGRIARHTPLFSKVAEIEWEEGLAVDLPDSTAFISVTGLLGTGLP